MKHLLIVDDDPHLLDSLRFVFAGLYELFFAHCAEEAIPILQSESIDVMLLDVVLPGMSGIDFLAEVRTSHPDLPVVMISGASSLRPVLQALELGAHDYIRKPFDVDELRLVVCRTLKNCGLKLRVQELENKLAGDVPLTFDRPLKEAVENYERAMIRAALRSSGGVQTRAAEVLGTTRRILRYRIEKLGIHIANRSHQDEK